MILVCLRFVSMRAGGAAVLAHQLCGLISLASRADGMSLLLLRAYVLTAQFIRSSFGKVFQSVDYILNTLLSQNLCPISAGCARKPQKGAYACCQR